MPTGNQLVDWSTVRGQIGSGLKWLTSDPGVGTLPNARINTSGEFWSYIRTTDANPYGSNRCMDWNMMVAHRKLNVSNYGLHVLSPNSSGTINDSASGSAPNYKSAMTLEMWVRVPSGSQSGNVFSYLGSRFSGVTGYALQVVGVSTTTFRFQWGTGLQANYLSTYYASGTLSTGTWYHIALVGNGSSFSSYINGSLYGSGYTVGDQTANASPMNLRICEGDIYVGGGGLNADVDEIRWWSVARTASQISSYMNTDTPDTTTGLYAHYKFENDLTDAQGNQNLTIRSGGTAAYITDTGF